MTEVSAQVDGKKLCLTALQAPNLLEFLLFVGSKEMVVRGLAVKLFVCVAKHVAGIEPTKGELSVEFIPDTAVCIHIAFQDRKTNSAVFDGDLLALVVIALCYIQVAARKQQPEPLVGNAHPVNLELGPNCLNRGAGDSI